MEQLSHGASMARHASAQVQGARTGSSGPYRPNGDAGTNVGYPGAEVERNPQSLPAMREQASESHKQCSQAAIDLRTELEQLGGELAAAGFLSRSMDSAPTHAEGHGVPQVAPSPLSPEGRAWQAMGYDLNAMRLFLLSTRDLVHYLRQSIDS
jgi:hypothetical protein